MRRTAIVAVLGIFAITTTGCGLFGGDEESASVDGRVAVVDLDKVAKALGRDVDMSNSLKEQQESLTEQLKTAQASFVKQITDKKDGFLAAASQTSAEFTGDPSDTGSAEFASATEELSAEENQQLVGMAREASAKLNQARREAGNKLGTHRAKLVKSFRDEVKPVALEIAKAKGMSIVCTNNDSVIFAHESAVDITNAVIAKLKGS